MTVNRQPSPNDSSDTHRWSLYEISSHHLAGRASNRVHRNVKSQVQEFYNSHIRSPEYEPGLRRL